jgi:hypothetical protein
MGSWGAGPLDNDSALDFLRIRRFLPLLLTALCACVRPQVQHGLGRAEGPWQAGACNAPGLVWKSARKTNYESYPAPGSEECVAYNGCAWAGQFAACDGKRPPAWVASHDIAALFPSFKDHALHDLCIRSGARTMIVTVLDTCADTDCDGCCTRNRGSADALIDLEKATNERWGLPDGDIQWADLGPTRTTGCK